jgi:hypothetical protein
LSKEQDTITIRIETVFIEEIRAADTAYKVVNATIICKLALIEFAKKLRNKEAKA